MLSTSTQLVKIEIREIPKIIGNHSFLSSHAFILVYCPTITTLMYITMRDLIFLGAIVYYYKILGFTILFSSFPSYYFGPSGVRAPAQRSGH